MVGAPSNSRTGRGKCCAPLNVGWHSEISSSWPIAALPPSKCWPPCVQAYALLRGDDWMPFDMTCLHRALFGRRASCHKFQASWKQTFFCDVARLRYGLGPEQFALEDISGASRRVDYLGCQGILAIQDQGADQSACRCKTHPPSRCGLIVGDFDQPCRYGRREAAKDCGCKAVSQ